MGASSNSLKLTQKFSLKKLLIGGLLLFAAIIIMFITAGPAQALTSSSRVYNNNTNQNWVSMYHAPNPRYSSSKGLISDGSKFWMQCYVIQSAYPFYGNYSSTKWFYGYANATGWGYVHSSWVYYQISVPRC